MEKLKDQLIKKGASLVGFAKVEGLYTTCDLLGLATSNSENDFSILQYPFGVSIALKIPKDIIKGISKHPTMDYFNAYHKLNHKLDELALYCEQYINSKGYHAYAQTVERTKQYGVFNSVMPHKTVAVCAGIGWIGKSALLVTPEFGSAVRLTSVLTDANLQGSDTIVGLPCHGCNICKDACPGGAIVGNEWNKDGKRDDIFDALICRNTARRIAKQSINKEITLCGKCIEVCPYTKRYLNSKE